MRETRVRGISTGGNGLAIAGGGRLAVIMAVRDVQGRGWHGGHGAGRFGRSRRRSSIQKRENIRLRGTLSAEE